MVHYVTLFINNFLLLSAILWLLFTGGFRLVLLYLLAYALGPHFMGILECPVGLLAYGCVEKWENKKWIRVMVYVWEWLIVTLWGVITIVLGVFGGEMLSLNSIPTLMLCYCMAISPFWRISGFVFNLGERAFVAHTLKTCFVELSSVLSVLILYFSSILSSKLQDMIVMTTCVFGIIGILEIFIRLCFDKSYENLMTGY